MGKTNFTWLNAGITAPKGFKAAGIASGIKKNGTPDMAMVTADVPCAAAGVFTSNKVKAAPLKYDMEIIGKSGGTVQGLLINSGNANAAVKGGLETAEKCARLAQCESRAKAPFLVASTGVIGEPLPYAPFETGVPKLAAALSKDGGADAARAIMTTDTVKKEFALSFGLGGKTVTIGAMAKGSGMIHINMATMLAFFTTDAAIDAALLSEAFGGAMRKTLNQVSVDGDTSTNDMAVILADGLAGNEVIAKKDGDYKIFYDALVLLTQKIAKAIAKDGEGATKLIECRVAGAPDDETAQKIAKTVVSSSLLKAAIFGKDANWGRIICAVGYSPGDFNVEDVSISISSQAGSVLVCENSGRRGFSEERALKVLGQDEIIIDINLHDGAGSGVAWGCDLTYDYVKINGEYRS